MLNTTYDQPQLHENGLLLPVDHKLSVRMEIIFYVASGKQCGFDRWWWWWLITFVTLGRMACVPILQWKPCEMEERERRCWYRVSDIIAASEVENPLRNPIRNTFNTVFAKPPRSTETGELPPQTPGKKRIHHAVGGVEKRTWIAIP